MKIKSIKSYPKYVVTDTGSVFNIDRGNELKPFKNPKGYLLVRLGPKDTKQVHRLVANAFIHNPFPDKFTQVNHLDGNKSNNSCENLEWVDNSGNIRHAYETGLIVGRCGEDNHMNKISEQQAIRACEMFVQGYSPSDVARFFGDIKLRHLLYRIKARKNWTYISNRYNF